MNKNLNLEYLPVYYHIAKNAGTYMLSSINNLLDQYLQSKDKQEDWGKVQAEVRFPSGNVCTVLLADNLGRGSLIAELYQLLYHAEIASQHWEALDIGRTYPNTSPQRNSVYARSLRGNACEALLEKYPNSHTYEDYKTLYNETIPKELKNLSEFSLEEFMSYLQQNEVFIFAVIIEPRNSGSSFVKSNLMGWEDSLKFIEELCAFYNRQPINFLTLREPFSRATSLFNYIKSSDSDHEFISSNAEVCDFFDIKSDTFEEYIQTGELEDSWFIRQLLSLPYNQPITEESFTLAINKLKDFHIKDITQVDFLIEEIFSKLYNLSFLNLLESNTDCDLNKHQSSQTDKLRFDQLSPDLQQKFIDRTQWDKKLYNYFTQ
jgi:hypothetical protein